MSTSHEQKLLKEAQERAKVRAKERLEAEPQPDVSDLSEAECFVRLVIAMYAFQLGVGMGVLPDGMAIWIRLRVPADSSDERAGMVAFVAHNDPATVLRKAVLALEASPKSNWWKPDRFAASQTA